GCALEPNYRLRPPNPTPPTATDGVPGNHSTPTPRPLPERRRPRNHPHRSTPNPENSHLPRAGGVVRNRRNQPQRPPPKPRSPKTSERGEGETERRRVHAGECCDRELPSQSRSAHCTGKWDYVTSEIQ